MPLATADNIARDLQAAVIKRRLSSEAPSDKASALLLDATRHAEWQDKHIHPRDREVYQNWKLTVYLPVPLSEADKSPEAALRRALGIANQDRPGLGTALEFTTLGDLPPTPEQARAARLAEAREDREWAQFAEGRMG